ncbi:MAG TPA: polysaccharide pyruvyl transferase family protein, partial [Kiritimatiellia bacterium]
MSFRLPNDEELARLRAGARFDRAYYLVLYDDVAAAGIDPLLHFIHHGAAEGRLPHAGYDAGDAPDADGLHPCVAYLLEGRPPAPRAGDHVRRVLIDTPYGVWLGENIGDVAMCASALLRIAETDPSCVITVVTDDPQPLAFTGVSFESVPSNAKRHWLRDPSYPGARLFVNALACADVVVSSGRGAMTDRFAPEAISMLCVLAAAARRGARTAALGMGIGPIIGPRLHALAAEVLPRIDRVCIRENRDAPGLLNAWGVPPDRVTFTGDDATRLCADASLLPDGSTGLGLCIRVGLGVNLDMAEKVGALVRNAAQSAGLSVVPLPIDADDVMALRQIGFPCTQFADPPAMLAAARKCRAVVSGSYHANVLSLSQGIPAVLLSAGSWYRSKMSGLVDWFPSGCRLVDLDQSLDAIPPAIEEVLSIGPDDRGKLIASARRQREAGDRVVSE